MKLNQIDHKNISDMINFINKNRITSLRKLRMYAINNREDWTNTLKFRNVRYELHEYIASIRRNNFIYKDPITGVSIDVSTDEIIETNYIKS